MLINVVGIEQRGFVKGFQQVLGNGLDEGLGVGVGFQRLEHRRDGFFPALEEPGGGFVEGSELVVAEDGGLDLRRRDAELAVAAMGRFLEESGAHAGDDIPVGMEGVEIALGDAAAQVGGEVLDVLGLGAVDVAGQVEIVVVFRIGDFRDRDHAGIAGDIALAGEGVHDAVDVLLAEAVLGAVFPKALAGINHEDAFAGLGMLLVDDDDAGRNPGAVEEVRRQADDALDEAALDDVLANRRLGISPEEDAVREDAGPLAGGLERADDVEEVGEVALLVGRDAVAFEPLVGIVRGIEAGGPAFVAEGGIGGGVVESLEQVPIEEERIREGVALLDLRRGVVVEDHVHAGEAGGGAVLFLTIQGDAHVLTLTGHGADLQEQGGRTRGRVVGGGVGTDDGLVHAEDQGKHETDLGRGEELALALAALGGEVAHQILVGVAEQVVAVGAVLREIEGGILEDGDQVGEALDHLLATAELVGVVEVGEVGLGELRVGLGERAEDVLVDLVADVGLALECDHVGEAGPRRNDDGRVFFPGVFVADVFDEEQDEHVVLVLAGIHAPAQLVAGLPERGVKFGFFEGHEVSSGKYRDVGFRRSHACNRSEATRRAPAQPVPELDFEGPGRRGGRCGFLS